jgi:hypothetical protein
MKYFIVLSMKMELIENSESLAIRTQAPGNCPKENIIYFIFLLNSTGLFGALFKVSLSERSIQWLHNRFVLELTCSVFWGWTFTCMYNFLYDMFGIALQLLSTEVFSVIITRNQHSATARCVAWWWMSSEAIHTGWHRSADGPQQPLHNNYSTNIKFDLNRKHIIN